MNAKCRNVNEIIIDHKACKGCQICIDQCSKNVLKLSDYRSAMGYFMPEAIELIKCSGCRICEMICPDLAITVEGELDEK